MYSAEISRVNPTCFLFLIDQSKSMRQPLAGAQGRTKAQAVADAVNHLLYALVLRCIKGDAIYDRFQVGVIGYGGDQVGSAYGGVLAGRDLVPVSEVANSPIRVEDQPHLGASFPVWFEPVGSGNTPMCGAVRRASMLLAGFLVDHPDCFPPIVINITDGKPNDGNPLQDAERLQQLSSTDGNVLFFNLHVSELSAEQVFFPDSEYDLTDNYARLLFRMSSTLPPSLWEGVRERGLAVSPGTRGFVFNGDLDSIIQALDIGTRVLKANRM